MARNLRIASVVVDLVANSARYIAGLREANRDTQRYTRSMQRSFDNLTRNIAGMAAGYLGVSAAINQFNKSLANAKEMEILSQLAGQSVEEFQAAAYATNQYGISAEKLGDISKDVADKLGDFIATGGGEFKDFFEQVAPKVGLTAQALEHLSGPDVLLRVKKAMEDANVPMKQQIFYLEAIANDASKLIPLLANNGEAWHTLGEEARAANVVMSEADISTLRDSELILSRLSQQISTSFAQGVAGAAEQIEWLGGFISNRLQDIGFYLDSFADNPRNLGNIKASIDETRKSITELEAALPKYKKYGGGGIGALWDSLLGDVKSKSDVESELALLKEKEKELMQLYTKTHPDYRKSAVPEQPTVNAIGGGTDPIAEAQKKADAIIKANQRILDSLTRDLATQKELIDLNAQQQVDQINALVLTEEQLEKTKYDNLLQLQSAYLLQVEAARLEAHENLNAKTAEETDAAAANFDKMAAAIGANTETMKQAANSWANSFSTDLANMVMKGEMDFGRLAESIINDILRIAIQAQITQPILDSLFGAKTTGGGTTPAPVAPAGLATGGPVMRGKTYLVGEKGPELFTASNTGNIVPNNQLGSSTQVNIYTQPGETAETRTRQGENGDIIEVFMKQVDSRMNEQISRGQGLARTLEGRYSLSRKSY